MATTAKKKAQKRVYCGTVSGTGENVTAARADLMKNLEAACEGTYDPLLITYKSNTILLWRTPTGYEYKLMRGDERTAEGVNRVSAGTIMGGTDRNEAIQSAAHHVISVEGDDFHDESEIPTFLTDRQKRRDIIFCCRFQRAYRWAQANKPEGRDNDHLWHEWACWHANDEQFH